MITGLSKFGHGELIDQFTLASSDQSAKQHNAEEWAERQEAYMQELRLRLPQREHYRIHLILLGAFDFAVNGENGSYLETTVYRTRRDEMLPHMMMCA